MIVYVAEMDGNRRITVRIPIPSALEEGRRITVRLVRGLQEARQIHELNTFERTLELRAHSDPFSMPESDFAMNFSLPKLLARMLIREMSPFLSKSDIPPHIKVCIMDLHVKCSHLPAVAVFL